MDTNCSYERQNAMNPQQKYENQQTIDAAIEPRSVRVKTVPQYQGRSDQAIQ
jgi:hypothetical protein